MDPRIVKCPACQVEVEAFVPKGGDGSRWALAGHYTGPGRAACHQVFVPAEPDVVAIPEEWRSRTVTLEGAPTDAQFPVASRVAPVPPVTYGVQDPPEG